MLLVGPLLASALVLQPPPRWRAATVRMQAEAEEAGLVDQIWTGLQVFQRSQSEGLGFKQAMADGIAGEYDREAVERQIKEEAASAPLVLFTWESSPSCKKALEYLKETGATPKVIRLDEPWAEGNPKRAALGRLTGKSSVPSVWIGGAYAGGGDDGPSEEAPGLVKLAFRGELKAKLEAAGAL